MAGQLEFTDFLQMLRKQMSLVTSHVDYMDKWQGSQPDLVNPFWYVCIVNYRDPLWRNERKTIKVMHKTAHRRAVDESVQLRV